MSGYILAFISSIFFSLYVVPRKISKLSAVSFSFFMALGFLGSSLALYAFELSLGINERWSGALWWSVVAGVVWAAGFVALVKAIDVVGLARSNQWKNLQGPIGVILSLIILGEWATTQPFWAVLAGVMVALSAVCFTVAKPDAALGAHLRGVYLAIVAGTAFGVVTVINKYVTTHVGVYSQQVVWSLAILLTLAGYVVAQKRLVRELREASGREISLGLGAGVLYLGASFFMLESYRYLPAAVGFTIIQLNAIWTVLIGIFLFREIEFKRHMARISIGLVFAVVGVMLLGLARL